MNQSMMPHDMAHEMEDEMMHPLQEDYADDVFEEPQVTVKTSTPVVQKSRSERLMDYFKFSNKSLIEGLVLYFLFVLILLPQVTNILSTYIPIFAGDINSITVVLTRGLILVVTFLLVKKFFIS